MCECAISSELKTHLSFNAFLKFIFFSYYYSFKSFTTESKSNEMYECTNRLIEKWTKRAFCLMTVVAPLFFNFLRPIYVYYFYFATDLGNTVFDHAFEPYTIWWVCYNRKTSPTIELGLLPRCRWCFSCVYTINSENELSPWKIVNIVNHHSVIENIVIRRITILTVFPMVKWWFTIFTIFYSDCLF